MSSVKVSVCIPTYNGEQFVAEAIRSTLQQSFSDFELIIVDDCSSDSTWDIVCSFSDPRITSYRNAQRLGIPGNWNRCLALAHGDYLCLFHQDDVMLAENLAQKVSVLSADFSIGLVHSAIEVIVENSAPRRPGKWVEESGEDIFVDGRVYFRKLLLGGNLICAPTVLCRRQALVDIGGFNEHLHFAGDYEAWLRICVQYKVAFLSQPLVRYRWHGGNETHQFWFERGVEESATAAHNALQYYVHCTGQRDEAVILEEAVARLTTIRLWLAYAEKGREGWEKGYQDLQRVVDNLQANIQPLQTHVAWLEESKTWLEENKRTLEREVQALQAEVERQKLEMERQKLEMERQRRIMQELHLWITTIEDMRFVQLLNKLRVLPPPPPDAVIREEEKEKTDGTTSQG